MPNSTRSNKETQLLYSSDPGSLEGSIRKEVRSSSIDHNTCSSYDFRQPLSIKALVLSTDTRSPPSTEDTYLPSTDIFHPTSIDTSVLTSIDTEPRDIVATLILVRDERGDLHDQEGHLHNAAGHKMDAQGLQFLTREAARRRFRSRKFNELRRIALDFEHRPTDFNLNRSTGSPEHRSMTPMESTASCNTVRILTHEEFAARHPHPPSPVYVKIDRHSDTPAKPKPSNNRPETIRIPSDDAADPMEVDRVPMGRTLRKIKEKVVKHLKRRANEKERKSFQKRVFKIPLEKPFEEAYFTHRLWMFFRETRETEEGIRRMFCEAREKMRKRITLKKKSDPGQFAIPCTVEPSKELFTFVDYSHRSSGGIVRDLEVQIGNVLVPVDFHVLDIKLNWNSSLLLGRHFLSIVVVVVCNLQSNQLCMTRIDPHTYYNPIPVKKPPTSSRRINDPGIIAACHCGAQYETEYSASIETHIATSIDSAHQKSTDTPGEESVNSSLEDWENGYYNPIMAAYTRHNMHTEEYDEDYEEERATESRAILDEEEKHLHLSSWKRNAPSINRTVSTSIDTQPHQTNRKRASTDIAYYPSIDTRVDRVREGDYSIGSWADDHHHESYAVETAIHEPGVYELHESFTYKKLLNMQRHDEADQHQAETTGKRTCFSHSIDRAIHPSIDERHPSSIDIRPKPKSIVTKTLILINSI
ncbi:hypothetical protein DY000_02014930 [Brassica cretica]|uniref:Uncharacterized protein n=1 Tax=Brassica cretica TaxID=69181 RepID=A0ABQ7D7B7_BRACR|nr:hypothetical protein DY000_02014930 [Brassica cretica]